MTARKSPKKKATRKAGARKPAASKKSAARKPKQAAKKASKKPARKSSKQESGEREGVVHTDLRHQFRSRLLDRLL